MCVCIYIYIYRGHGLVCAVKNGKDGIFQGFIVKTGFPSAPKFGLTRKPFLISLVYYTTIPLCWTPPIHTHTHTRSRGFNIFNISADKRRLLLGKMSFFRGNVEYVEFWGPMLNQNVLLSAEMLNMLNVLGEIRRWPLAREFHIFNISAERSTF